MIDRNEIVKVSAPVLTAMVVLALFAAAGVMLSAYSMGAMS